MRKGLNMFIVMTGILETILSVDALKCWKCIAHDCNSDLEDNYKAAKVKCQEGQVCMKVRYRMYDNVTHYDSVIRTCSDTKCDTPSINDFLSCINNPAKYMIGGCTLRSCCDDRDLCNSCDSTRKIHYISFLTLCLSHFVKNIIIYC